MTFGGLHASAIAFFSAAWPCDFVAHPCTHTILLKEEGGGAVALEAKSCHHHHLEPWTSAASCLIFFLVRGKARA